MITSATERIKELGIELLPQSDGSLEIRKPGLERRARRPGAVVGALAWNGVTFLILAAVTGRLPGEWEVTEGAPGAAMWVLGFFALVGLSWIWQLLWTWFGREEWIASRNRFEVRQRLFGVPRRRIYVDSDFQLERVAEQHWLLGTGAGLRRRILIYHTFSDTKEAPALFDLAEVLGARTGWRVRAPERPGDAIAGKVTGSPSAPPIHSAPEVPAHALDPDLRAVADRELEPGERLFWLGRPDARRVALQAAPVLIFGIPWTLFALSSLLGRELSLSLFSLMPAIFALFGIAMCCSPVSGYYKALRTIYAVTDRRVLILTEGKNRTVESYGPGAISGIERKEHSDASGDLVFARKQEKDSDGDQRTVEIKFIGIPKVREVERLLRSLFATDLR